MNSSRSLAKFAAPFFSRFRPASMVQFAAEVLGFVSLNKRAAFLSFFSILFILAIPAFGQSEDACPICHSRSSLKMTKRGRVHSLFVDRAALKESAHSSLTCLNCHSGLDPQKIPHADIINPVQCRTCHEISGFETSVHGTQKGAEENGRTFATGCKSCHGTHEIRSSQDQASRTNRSNVSRTCSECHKEVEKEYFASAHGEALAAGASRSPSCVNCHGAHNIVPTESEESALFKTKEARQCLQCHLDDPETVRQVGISAGFIASYETSVHGMAISSGNLMAATCSDCHGSHDLKKSDDPSSRMSKWSIAETCSYCHFDAAAVFNESIHGKALIQGIADAPTCTDCHGEHQIYASSDPRSRVAPKNVSEQVCAACHNSAQLNEKYGLAADRFNSYSDSYHGLATRAGAAEVANCASCHGIHNIKPASDPESTIHKNNLPATCGRCHLGANENFARGAVHIISRPDSKASALYWIRIIYIALILVIIGSMLLHNLLDFMKKSRRRLAVRRGEVIPERHGKAQYVRMTLDERIQHAVVLVSFTLLAVTGFMLRHPDSWWVVPIRRLSDSFFEVRSIIHRIAGAVIIAISLYHFFYISFTRRGKQLMRDIKPKWSDVVGAWKNIFYIAGLSRKKPRFDRFGYVEKIEYWALFWGIVIMSLTGILLLFENFSIGLFTKLGWDIARAIHFYEACLASLAIVVWHFYFVIFNPDVYPMNTTWITGKISEEQMEEEHPLELDRIKRQAPDDSAE